MTRGGARPRSGPPRDPNALRRERDKDEWAHLAASGREGDPPAWPLTESSKREDALWASEWARPQAIEWERLGLVLEVALYVRNVVAAEKADASPPLRALVMRQMDSLGLTLGGLRANRWVIDDGGTAQQEAEQPSGEVRSSVKDRLKLVV